MCVVVVVVVLSNDLVFIIIVFSFFFFFSFLFIIKPALERLKKQFGEEEDQWEETTTPGGGKKFTYKKGRLTIYQGDMFVIIDNLVGGVDVVVDKDAFGALPKEMRENYVNIITKYLKKGGVMVSETKKKNIDVEKGPPFHLLEEDMKKEWERKGEKEGEGGLVYEEFLGEFV